MRHRREPVVLFRLTEVSAMVDIGELLQADPCMDTDNESRTVVCEVVNATADVLHFGEL